MASNNGYLTHCRICGTPIFSLGNRQFCSACYAQNRRNAAHRSNAEAKMRREQAKREEEKMKACCGAHNTAEKVVKLHVHHLESRKTGGNAPSNLVTLCTTCHKNLHKGKVTLDGK